MKRILALILSAVTVLSVFALPVSVSATTVETPTDVPKVLIYTNEEIPRDPYVACEISIIDEEGGSYETIVDTEASVKVRGNSTSSADKKPYNIKFSSKTDVLGMGKAKKWCLLANCYDKTLLRNAVVFDVARELGVPYTPDYRYVDVYVNDEIMGSYLLTEAVEVDSNRVDIDTDNNEYLLELDWNPEDEDSYYFYSFDGALKFAINEPEKSDLTQEQIDYVEGLISKAESALQSGNYEEVQKYFDIESMASFYLLLEYFRNIDVATSSTRFHIKNDKIYGGPAWDFDLSSGNYNDGYYTWVYSSDGTCYKGLHATGMEWFGELVGYSDFQALVNDKFISNYAVFENIYADNGLGTNKIDSMIDTYGASIDRNHIDAGWTPDRVYNSNLQLERTPDATYVENVEYYRGWLESRTAWLMEEWNITLPEDCDHGNTVETLLDDGSTNVNCASCGDLIESIPAPCDHVSVFEVYNQDGTVEIRCENCNELIETRLAVNVREQVTSAELVSDLVPDLVPEGSTATVEFDNAVLADDDYVPHGSVVATEDGVRYNVIVLGDILPDAKVDMYDYMVVKCIYLGTYDANASELAAANVNGDEQIDMYDALAMKSHILGRTDLYSLE